jgi:phosphoglycolate phosphatase
MKALVFDVSGTLVDARQGRNDLFDGARPFLHAAHGAGLFLALATNLPRRSLNAFLDSHSLRGLFHAHASADEAAFKPDPAMINLVLAGLDLTPGDALMIGDSDGDILMAHNANVLSCAAGWGDLSDDVLKAGPTYIARSFDDLARLVGVRGPYRGD